MKGLVSGSLSALMVAIVASAMTSPASARPAITTGNPYAADLAMTPESTMTFKFTAPFITSSGALGTNYFIRLAVVGMSLNDLMISLPAQMERYDSIRVVDQTGKDVPAKISATKSQVSVAFDQPVTPGNYLQVLFTGVDMRNPGGEVLLYGVSGERSGLKGQIPIGTARVQTPSRE